ncbi:MAG: alpha/beta hydrolase [Steroidobacteraceae bacterium]|nr:alpha/beta hydrolase [Steroidobacteraceae bacterium]
MTSAATPSTTAPTTATLAGAHGNRLCCTVHPAAGAVGVVFLHGGGQSRHSWRRAAQALQARGFPAFTFDMRGHNDSEWLADGRYRVEDFEADLTALLGQWRVPAILVGASLGGLAALMVAGTDSPWVRGLVVVDNAPLLSHREVTRYVDFMSHGAQNGFASVESAVAHLNAFFPESPVSPEQVRRGLRETPAGRWVWRWDARIIVGPTSSVAIGYEPLLQARARNVRVPFLMVKAGASDFVTPEAIEDLQRCAPHVEIAVLQGARHMITGDDNLPFVEVAMPFLERVAREAAVGA